MKRILLFALYTCLSINAQYMECNNTLQQKEYMENERRLFNVPEYELPFNYSEVTTDTIDYFPTACLYNGTIVRQDTLPRFLLSRVNKFPKNYDRRDRLGFLDKTITTTVNVLWSFLGWKRETHYNEEYWVYKNEHSNHSVVYLHGINKMDGFENMYLLTQLTNNATVYFSIYKPSFLSKQEYKHTYSEHIDNLRLFLNTLTNVSLYGHSYGSIRATTLCKRYDCSSYNKIVLLDPLSINTPYSQIHKHLLFGLFVNHEERTASSGSLFTIMSLNSHKQYNHMIDHLDWYEWTVDTVFMERYRDILTLVISDNDNLITVDKTSYALTNICKVVYTNTSHGLVIFTQINKII
jgi:hypothetical protein